MSRQLQYLERVMDDVARDPDTLREVEESRLATSMLIARLQVSDITGAHALTYRWFNAYRLGIESAAEAGTFELVRAFGMRGLEVAAKRFAAIYEVDVPSAWMLGFTDEVGRTIRRLDL